MSLLRKKEYNHENYPNYNCDPTFNSLEPPWDVACTMVCDFDLPLIP